MGWTGLTSFRKNFLTLFWRAGKKGTQKREDIPLGKNKKEINQALAGRCEEPPFRYVSTKDRMLVRQAMLLCCDAFQTKERRL